MKVHLYRCPNGRIVAVDNCRNARAHLPAFGPPTPMFDGKPVAQSVASGWIRDNGGMWYRADGVRRYKGSEVELQAAARGADNPMAQLFRVFRKNAV